MAVTLIEPTDVYSLTFFFGMGKNGWTEKVYVKINSGNERYPLMRAFASEYANIRRRMMHANAVIEAVRISSETLAGDALLQDKNDIPALGKGTVIGTPAHVDSGYLVTVANSDGQIRSHHIFRGLAAQFLPNIKPDGSDANELFINSYRKDVEALGLLLSTGFSLNAGGINTLNAVIATTNGRDPATAFLTAFNWGISATGYLEFSVSVLPAGMDVGTKLKITAKRRRCVRGVSGNASVVNIVGAPGGPIKIVTDRRPCCPPDDIALVSPKAQVRLRRFVAVGKATMRNLTDRDTGRAFFAGVGRRPSKCCG